MEPELEEKLAEVVEAERDMGEGEGATELEEAVEQAEEENPAPSESPKPVAEEDGAGHEEPAEEPA